MSEPVSAARGIDRSLPAPATLHPVWRASRVRPVEALRHE